MEHNLVILDHTGHRALGWDPALDASVQKVRDVFNQMKQDGHLAYTLDTQGQGEVIKSFDPAANTIILTPPMVGG